MTTSRITLSGRIGLSHIDAIPVKNDGGRIILFDMYTKDGVWLGSKRTLRYVKDFNNECKRN
jgi:hypothetical protein